MFPTTKHHRYSYKKWFTSLRSIGWIQLKKKGYHIHIDFVFKEWGFWEQEIQLWKYLIPASSRKWGMVLTETRKYLIKLYSAALHAATHTKVLRNSCELNGWYILEQILKMNSQNIEIHLEVSYTDKTNWA